MNSNLNRLLLISVLIFTLVSCNQNMVARLMSKTPKLEIEKSDNYKKFNDYQKDVVYLSELILQTYPRLDTKLEIDDFHTKTNELISELANTNSDFDFSIKLKRYVALLRDGHSRFSEEELYSKDKKYFSWYLFNEGKDWRISAIDKSEDSTIIGAKVVSIEGHTMKEIEAYVRDFESAENQHFSNFQFQSKVRYPKYWKALGIIDKEDEISFTVELNNETKTIKLQAKEKLDYYGIKRKKSEFAFTRKQNNGYSYKIDSTENYAYLQMNTSLDYVCINSELKNYTNFFVRPFAKAFLKKQTKDALNFGETLQSLFGEMHEKGIENLIVDLRNNMGGDERTGKQLIWYITENTEIIGFQDYLKVSKFFKKTAKSDFKKYNEWYSEKYGEQLPYGEINLTKEFFFQPYFYEITKQGSPFLLDNSIPRYKGNVYVLIGTKTFSAGQYLATTLADNKLATIIGTPSGNKPTCQTGASLLKLPNTKKIITMSYTFGERPDTTKNNEDSLYPDIEIHQTLEDVINGKDIQFEYIVKKLMK